MSNSVWEGLQSANWVFEDHADLIDGIWIPRKDSFSPVSYPEDFRSRLADLEDTSLWFRSRNVLIQKVLDRYTDCSALLEVGAGNGSVSSYLQRHGIDTLAVEPSVIGASRCLDRGVEHVVAGHLEDLELPSEAVSAIGIFDVIEHLEDPTPLLLEIHRVLKKGGWCVITVPAYNSLWSQADDHAGHRRRYSKKTLHTLMCESGFERRFASYCFAGALPLLFAQRTMPYRRGLRLTDKQLEESLEEELSQHGGFAKQLGQISIRLETWWLELAPIPFGTSVVAVYRKD